MSQFKTTGKFQGGLPVEAHAHERQVSPASAPDDERLAQWNTKWAADDAAKRASALDAAIPDRNERHSLINSARSALMDAEVKQVREERKHSDLTHPALRKAADKVRAAARTIGVLHGDRHTILVSPKGARYYVDPYGKKVYIK